MGEIRSGDLVSGPATGVAAQRGHNWSVRDRRPEVREIVLHETGGGHRERNVPWTTTCDWQRRAGGTQ